MVHIVRTAWSGTSGGPGVTQLAIDTVESTFGPLDGADAQAAVNAVRIFWAQLAPSLPDEITLTVSPTIDYYLADTAELTGSVSAASAPAAVLGTSASVFSMATGPKLNLLTGSIRFGRRVKGGIYLVPGGGVTQGPNGMIATSSRTDINTAAATLLGSLATASLKMVVWSRPIPSGKPNGPREGGTSDVTSIQTGTKLAILRGRRD